MNDASGHLATQSHALKDEIARRPEKHRQKFGHRLHSGTVVFEAKPGPEHGRVRMGIVAFLRSAELCHGLVAPVTYAMLIPLALLALGMNVCQHICFRA